MIEKSKISISEGLQNIAKKYKIPEIIPLQERTRDIETVLVFCGYVEGDNCGLEKPQFNYRILAEFPYTLHGEKEDYKGIDFSGGPTLWKENKIADNLLLVNIEHNLLTFEITTDKI